ncbi:MAG: hypothetical protein ABIU95_13540, partial [Burkholderiales bacterium]
PFCGMRVMRLAGPMFRGAIKGIAIFAFTGSVFAYMLGWASFGIANVAQMECRRINAGDSFADARTAAKSRVQAPARVEDVGLGFRVVVPTSESPRDSRNAPSCDVQGAQGKVLHATYRPTG